MAEKTTVISLTQTEMLELEAILVDDDQQEALRFLRDVIKKKTDAAQTGRCRPPLDWGKDTPQ